MRTKIIGVTLVFVLSIQGLYAQTLEDEFADLMNKQDFFALQDRYDRAKDSLQSETVKLLAEAFLNTAFNQPDKANLKLDTILLAHQEHLGMSGIVASIVTMSDNLKRQGNYRQSADLLQSFLDQTATFDGLDSLTRKGLEKLVLWGALGDGMKPEIIRPERDCEIFYSDEHETFKNIIYVDVELNGNTVDFVFDTGADGYDTNLVSESFARQNGIRVLDDSVVITGTAERYVKLGVADSMKIGDIVYKNVAFTIAPGDNILPVDTLFMDAVLGSVFMKAVGEIQIYPKEKRMVFPYEESKMPFKKPNMMFVGGQPYIEGYSGSERLLLHFDTGGGIGLSSKYYASHEEEVKLKGRLYGKGGVGGFGAMVHMDQYILPAFTLRVGAHAKELKDVYVLAGDGFSFVIGDGSLGNDFIKLFDKVTINYNQMFIDFE